MGSGEESSEKEAVRQLLELATSCGRKHQSEQTGFIHYCYTKEDETHNAAIPVYENLLFGLALIRSKSADTVQEGKALVEKILPFQNFLEELGNGGFPLYLHEYPRCKERLFPVRLLPVFATILEGFHQVLGTSLKAKLQEASRALLVLALRNQQEREAPFPAAFTLAVAAHSLGRMLNEPSFCKEGEAIMKNLPTDPEEPYWYSPYSLSELLIALQIADLSTLPKGWNTFWSYLSNTWSRFSCSYIGPGWCDYQWCREPKPSLYDLYMGFASGSYSYRSFVDHPYQLQAALIRSQPAPLPPPQQMMQGGVEHRWLTAQQGAYGVCLLRKNTPIPSASEKGYQPLKVVWGDRTRTHTFVCQGGNLETIHYDWHPDGHIEMEATLGALPLTEDKEKARELLFFTEALEGTQVTVAGLAATTFNIGDELEVLSGGMRFKVIFYIAEGDGNFMGHIMRGNRPSQEGLRGVHRLEAFDWQIYLRTVYRTTPCKLKACIQLSKVE